MAIIYVGQTDCIISAIGSICSLCDVAKTLVTDKKPQR